MVKHSRVSASAPPPVTSGDAPVGAPPSAAARSHPGRLLLLLLGAAIICGLIIAAVSTNSDSQQSSSPAVPGAGPQQSSGPVTSDSGSQQSSSPATSDSGSQQSSSSGTSAQEPVIRVMASQIVAEYAANEVAADARYKGKIICVSGTIGRIGKDILDRPYVILDGGEGEFRSVQASFEDKDLAQLAQLSKGQQVSIEGTCDGLSINVVLKNSHLIPTSRSANGQEITPMGVSVYFEGCSDAAKGAIAQYVANGLESRGIHRIRDNGLDPREPMFDDHGLIMIKPVGDSAVKSHALEIQLSIIEGASVNYMLIRFRRSLATELSVRDGATVKEINYTPDKQVFATLDKLMDEAKREFGSPTYRHGWYPTPVPHRY